VAVDNVRPRRVEVVRADRTAAARPGEG
jgi:hypothetical protein